ncbi:cation diffusion facilitator family transporter [Balneola sp. MJW-20]|uniref:cation diffusion facilitator family transporter n=1 Tax=Gracilimonas aurantiaca TaxID=3234185 RepID=UPI003466F697
MHTSSAENIRVQKYIVTVAVILFVIKITAWYLTGSIAILTDGLESIVNVFSGFVGLYSLRLSARPKDNNHPYGHGKVEFISAGIEGTLIIIAGIFIISESIQSFIEPSALDSLDIGIAFVSFSAIINYVFGRWALNTGIKNKSLALQASGKHLITDTYTTLGIIAGLILIRLTGILWIDGAVAILFGSIILITGLRILRKAVAGIMDESDEELLVEMINYLQSNRKSNWIDLHNLRIIKYGSVLHIDCHLTVPWYLNVKEAHNEVEELESLVRSKYGKKVEFFVHTDYCLEFSCRICGVSDCEVRKHEQEEFIEWTVDNVAANQKHSLET